MVLRPSRVLARSGATSWARDFMYRNAVLAARLSTLSVAVVLSQWALFQSNYVPLPAPNGPTNGIERCMRTIKEKLEQVKRFKARDRTDTHGDSSSTDGEENPQIVQLMAILRSRWEALREKLQRNHHFDNSAQNEEPLLFALSPEEGVVDDGGEGEGEGEGNAPPHCRRRRKRRILFVGDSLIVGVGCNEETGAVLPKVVAKTLADKLDVDIQWSAFGKVGGDVKTLHETLMPQVKAMLSANATARGKASVAEAAMDEHEGAGGGSSVVSMGFADDEKVDAVVLMCGLNDWKVALLNGKTPADFRSDLESLVSVLHDHLGSDCHVVLPALPVSWTTAFPEPMRSVVLAIGDLWDAEKQKLAAASDRVRATIKEIEQAPPAERMQVVKENALGIIDFIGAPVKPEREETALGWDLAASKMDDFFWAEDYSPEPEDDRFMSADGVHPNEVGYNVWAQHIAMILGEVLEAEDRHRNRGEGEGEGGEIVELRK